jgi:general secretion pathway protein C
MMKTRFDPKRLTWAVTLFVASFLIAHSINAVIADQITAPSDQLSPSPTAGRVTDPSSADLSSPSPEELSEHILHSGLFVVPQQRKQHRMGSDVGDVGEVDDSTPPLNLAQKLVLRGTSYGDARLSIAMIEDISSKALTLYHLREDIPNAGELMEVRREGVRIRQGRREEFLPVSTGDPGEVRPMPVSNLLSDPKKKILLDRREVTTALADLSKLLGQARAVPYFVDGKVNGFHLTIFTPDSFFGRIGLITGDILKRVNGMEIRDPGQVIGLFQQVKDERVVKVDVLRQDRPTTLTYEIR